MKRLEGLVPLSHDHHQALLVALRLKKGGPSSWRDSWPEDPSGQRRALNDFAERELLPHFLIEEELLFPACSTAGGELAQTTTDLEADHRTMRSLLAKMTTAASDELPALLADFGALLETHVRKEERSFFPMVEEAVSNGQITVDMAQLAARHARYHVRPATTS